MSKLKSNNGWLSRAIPFGLFGQVKPHHFREMAAVVWENKRELPHAWNILRHGVCDGCSLGPYGLRDNVMEGVHLCTTRLKLLRVNTLGALQRSAITDAGYLKQLTQQKLRSLGRLPFPMVRHRGEKG